MSRFSLQNGKCRYSVQGRAGYCSKFSVLPEGDEKMLQKVLASVGPISVAVNAMLESFHMYSGGEEAKSFTVQEILVNFTLFAGLFTWNWWSPLREVIHLLLSLQSLHITAAIILGLSALGRPLALTGYTTYFLPYVFFLTYTPAFIRFIQRTKLQSKADQSCCVARGLWHRWRTRLLAGEK